MIKLKVIVGVTGASGALYAKKIFENIEQLLDQVEDIGVIFSKYAKEVWDHELGSDSFDRIPFKTYDPHDFYAPFASGSSGYHAFIICPCSMGTLGRIASGTSNDLISRAADVILKERQKLILVVREAPYNLVHIRNMEHITQAGGIIFPASPSFYDKPKSLDDAADRLTKRILKMVGFNIQTYQWG